MAKMNISPIRCKIEAVCSINLSEDPQKVESAILNIFPNCKIEHEKFSLKALSENLHTLEKIRESIHSMKSQKTFRRTLEKNLDLDTTWIYLNKQAAFAEKIAICEKSDESPLGPIKIIITSRNLDRIIEWLVFNEK